MNAYKHTPGPWRCGDDVGGAVLVHIQIVAGAGKYALASTGVFGAKGSGTLIHVGEDTTIANANLIAAAPELLEALEWAMPYLRLPEGADQGEFWRRYMAAQAALNKAVGVAPPRNRRRNGGKPKRMKAINQRQLVDAWNTEHPSGTTVYVRRDDGHEDLTRTRSGAWMMGGPKGVAVVMLDSDAACFRLDRCSVAALDHWQTPGKDGLGRTPA